MSLMTGGRADKLGNRYEDWWMVLQLIRLIEGEIESIQIEDPTVEKSECLVVSFDGEELHQNKRSRSSGSWTLSQLGAKNEKLLEAVFEQLDCNERSFYFVSGSDAPELRALSDQARNVSSFSEFQALVLSTKKHEKSFQRLREEWGFPTEEISFDVLRRIHVRILDEAAIQDQIHPRIRVLYLHEHAKIRSKLREIVRDRIGEVLKRDSLLDELASEGFQMRTITDAKSAARKVEEICDQYLSGIRKKLIGGTLIARGLSKQIVTRITTTSGPTNTVLLGQAGGGKSVSLMSVVDQLREAEIPVLAFRLDRLKPVSSGFLLGQELGLEESPSLIMSALGEDRPVVILIDQLDAVSTASGRSSEFLYAIESILGEVRNVSRRKTIHIILSCRRFDWENDSRLRLLIDSKGSKFELGDFTQEEVSGVLEAMTFDAARLNRSQLSLLERPQNLALFSELTNFSENIANFGSTKDLFDAYWDEKQDQVNRRSGSQGDHWIRVIDILTEEMTRSQKLSVRREKLDGIPARYAEQMISEGVLSKDGDRFSFGHESFFDYCFARSFIGKNEALVSVLESAEQHLFRRAQVRQVFAYLRDSAPEKYIEELKALLDAPGIRMHLKHLAVSLLGDASEVRDEEWEMLSPYLENQVKLVELDKEDDEPFIKMIWTHFFHSSSWFVAAHSRGWPQVWLNAKSERLVNLGVNYLRRHVENHGDKVARLLEPFSDHGGEWNMRLKGCMEWTRYGRFREFFNLFLKLVGNGVLDEARGPIAQNSTFWDMLHGLEDQRPEWVIEVLCVWLRRRLDVITGEAAENDSPKWSDFLSSEDSGAMLVSHAAKSCPQKYVTDFLPIALKISEESSGEETELPRRDLVWSNCFPSMHLDLTQVLQTSLRDAFATLINEGSKEIRPIIADLRKRTTYFSNGLLLRIFTEGAESFSEEALECLLAEKWRFRCGYSDSSLWVARNLVGAIASHLSNDRRQELENLVIGYRSTWEKSKTGRRYSGEANHILLGGIPRGLLTASGKKRFDELERKFGEIDRKPRGMRGGEIVSPVPEKAAQKMTDEQWLSAIKKYSSEDRDRFGENFLKGGARELARQMEKFVKEDPERFARLSLRFPDDTNSIYFEWILMALGGADCPTSMKLDVVRRAFELHCLSCGRSIASLLGGIADRLSDEFIDMLHWLVTKHPNPEGEPWTSREDGGEGLFNGSLTDCGLNSDRGRAVLAIADLIDQDGEYLSRFRDTIQALKKEKNLSVKACAAKLAGMITKYDQALALRLFLDFTECDSRLLATGFADRYLGWALYDRFEELRPSLESLFYSEIDRESKVGARLIALAKLYKHPVDELVEEALNGAVSQRLGIAKVVAKNVKSEDRGPWCQKSLEILFSDLDSGVRAEAAGCFRELSDENLSEFQGLIESYLESSSFQDQPATLLRTLEKTKHRLPELTLKVCETFLKKISVSSTGPFANPYINSSSVGKLVFRVYQQFQNKDAGIEALNLIDQMLLTGIGEAGRGFEEFER